MGANNGSTSGKKPACQWRRHKRHTFNLWVAKIPWKREWQPTPAFLPGESHGQRRLTGYSPRGCKESDTTKATWHIAQHNNVFLEVNWLIPVVINTRNISKYWKLHNQSEIKVLLKLLTSCTLRVWSILNFKTAFPFRGMLVVSSSS